MPDGGACSFSWPLFFLEPETMSSILKSSLAVLNENFNKLDQNIRGVIYNNILVTVCYLDCSFVDLSFNRVRLPDTKLLHVHNVACVSINSPVLIAFNSMLGLDRETFKNLK